VAISDSPAAIDLKPVTRQSTPAAPAELYRLTWQHVDVRAIVDQRDVGPPSPVSGDARPSINLEDSKRALFAAEQRSDGTYSLSLTEMGIRRFETALGIAEDFGRDSRVSNQSSIADLMERASTRDELSLALREGGTRLTDRIRCTLLRRRLAGSEEPSREHRAISHVGKAFIVGLVVYWTLQQLGIAFADIGSIPGILANIPSDVLNLDPSNSIDQAGGAISDAWTHVLFTGFGAVVTYVVAKLVKPFQRIYRRDQLVPGERPAIRLVSAILRGADRLRPGLSRG
jgi:hypothetical protein